MCVFLHFRCDTESQYARWMAALRLAAKGKTMADSGYDAEVKSIQAFLAMQHPASQPVINPNSIDINVEDYVAPRFLRKMKSKVRKAQISALLKPLSDFVAHPSIVQFVFSELLQLHSSMSSRSIGNGTEMLILRIPSFSSTNKYVRRTFACRVIPRGSCLSLNFKHASMFKWASPVHLFTPLIFANGANGG